MAHALDLGAKLLDAAGSTTTTVDMLVGVDPQGATSAQLAWSATPTSTSTATATSTPNPTPWPRRVWVIAILIIEVELDGYHSQAAALVTTTDSPARLLVGCRVLTPETDELVRMLTATLDYHTHCDT